VTAPKPVRIEAAGVALNGDLSLSENAQGFVLSVPRSLRLTHARAGEMIAARQSWPRDPEMRKPQARTDVRFSGRGVSRKRSYFVSASVSVSTSVCQS